MCIKLLVLRESIQNSFCIYFNIQTEAELWQLLMCRKQLKDFFDTGVLHETLMQILEMFMSMGSPHQWVDFLMPADARFYKLAAASCHENPNLPDVTKFDQLMNETRAVLLRYVHHTGLGKSRYYVYN